MTKFANMLGYSDITPFEVIRVVSEKTIEVREMEAERDESVKLDFQVGGFSAICTNQLEQKWFIRSNPENKVIRIRKQKNGTWKDAYGRRFTLGDEPVRLYDYNF